MKLKKMNKQSSFRTGKTRSDKTGVEREESKSLEVPFAGYIDHTKRLLKMFRMWKLENDLPTWKTVPVAVNAGVMLTCNLLLGLSELTQIKSAPDLARIASGIGAFWLHFLGFVKWFYLGWKVCDVMDLVGQLEECYNLSLGLSDSSKDSSKLAEEMNTAKKSSLRFTYMWSTFVSYGVVHWCVNPALLQLSSAVSSGDDEIFLPYEAWIPWDETRSLGYWFAYLIEFVGGFASGIGGISYDVFYLTMVMMICAQFRYLNYFLAADRGENDRAEVYFETKKKPTCGFLERKLIRGKTYHCAILKLVTSLEKVTSPVMFVQCIGTMGILCLVSFQVVTMKLKGNVKNAIRMESMLEYMIGGFTQLFAFCYYANQVTTLGLQVGDSAFGCGWESLISDKEAAKKERKAAGFLTREIITRAQRPVRLTGGPFYVLSLETYRAVIGTAFSCSAVLRELGNE